MQRLITSLTRTELSEAIKGSNQPAYRADQIWDWLYVKYARSWDEMKNLSSDLKKQLSENFILTPGELIETTGNTGETQKLLVRFPDTESIEEVLIPAGQRKTVCVSSQAGCRFHCAFCASGQAGFKRDLETGEIIAQVLLAAKVWKEKPTHVVFMGIGEPLDNYDNVIKAARIINDGDGINIGARRITISTCGVVPGIQKLSDEGMQIELSVSLHAPNDQIRSKLMPVNRKHPLSELIPACKKYAEKTKRIITFEYTMINGINDQTDHAHQLAKLLRPLHARVNLIPLSSVEEFEGKPSTVSAIKSFMSILERSRINVTLRDSKGGALKAACGQLRYARRAN